MIDTGKAERMGYIAGLNGSPSTPHRFMHSDVHRRAYEKAYDIGRAARLDELCSIED